MDQKTSRVQAEAAEAQKLAADATRDTALWTKVSAIAVAITVVVTGVGILLDVLLKA